MIRVGGQSVALGREAAGKVMVIPERGDGRISE